MIAPSGPQRSAPKRNSASARLKVTGCYVNRADDPVRTLSDHVGERIAAGLAGRKSAAVVGD